MTTATAPRGLTKKEYNALLHAIWWLDRQISECLAGEEDWQAALERDREGLSELFKRL